MKNRVITISREFGSGGRTIGREAARLLNIPCYDQEILQRLAEESGFSEAYVKEQGEYAPYSGWLNALASRSNGLTNQDQLWVLQRRLILELAEKGPCVIVGRCADYILRESNPTRIFVYADMESKIRRCFERAPENEHLTEKEMRQYIQKVDKNRAVYYEFYTGRAWGDWHNYDLCINTGTESVKEIAHHVAQYLKAWH